MAVKEAHWARDKCSSISKNDWLSKTAIHSITPFLIWIVKTKVTKVNKANKAQPWVEVLVICLRIRLLVLTNSGRVLEWETNRHRVPIIVVIWISNRNRRGEGTRWAIMGTRRLSRNQAILNHRLQQAIRRLKRQIKMSKMARIEGVRVAEMEVLLNQRVRMIW